MGEDIHDVTQWLSRTPRAWRYDYSENDEDTSHGWDLNVGWSGALLLSVLGWPEGRAKIGEGLADLPQVERAQRYTKYDVSGDRPDIQRMLAGDPMHMVSRPKRRVEQPITTIVLNMAMNVNVSSTSCVNLGVAMASMIDAIENRGQRVELTVVHNSMLNSIEVCTGWGVKQARDPLDLDQLAFAIAHPASFRRIGFAMRERTDPRQQVSWYGSSMALSPTMRERLGLPTDALVIDAPDLWYKCSTPASARAALAEKLGVE
jgi:hypothetical protein